MAQIVVMPALGNSVESCIINAWLVSPGDEVAEGQVLCEVETDKSTMEVPSTTDGVVLSLLWEEGADVPVMEPLLVIGEKDEDPAAVLAELNLDAHKADEGGDAVDEGTTEAPRQAEIPAQESAASSPRARALAERRHVDIEKIEAGSGPHGRVIERDVAAATPVADGSTQSIGLGGRVSQPVTPQAASSAKPDAEPTAPVTAPASGESTDTPIRGIRKVIAERMMSSLASSAQLTYTATVKAGGLLAMRKRLKKSDPELGLNQVTIGDLVGYAAIRTVLKHPTHNAHVIDGQTLRAFSDVHLGFACDTPRGLLVPVVHGAQAMTLGGFARRCKELAKQAIDGTIMPDLLTGATFTVSNLGGFGIESFTPILYAPQTAILGVDAIVPRATVDEDGEVGIEQRIGFSLTADHRVIDGADAARFLRDLCWFIENIEIAVLG